MPGKAGVSEAEFIAEMQAAHERDFAAFDIEFDNYGSTNSPENRVLCERDLGVDPRSGLSRRSAMSSSSTTRRPERFWPIGSCAAHAPTANRPTNPATIAASAAITTARRELIDPRSTLSGATPEIRKCATLVHRTGKAARFLEEWTQSGEHLQPEIANYLKGHFLGEPLRDWDISRPAPYFGFEIPDSPGNYWYVWFDAPIGYMASTQQWCDRTGEKLDDWWRSHDCEIHHFIGKDITYFHTLFWPGMLKTAGYSLPAKVHIHGFLTVDGEKMSKSKGTFVARATRI